MAPSVSYVSFINLLVLADRFHYSHHFWYDGYLLSSEQEALLLRYNNILCNRINVAMYLMRLGQFVNVQTNIWLHDASVYIW